MPTDNIASNHVFIAQSTLPPRPLFYTGETLQCILILSNTTAHLEPGWGTCHTGTSVGSYFHPSYLNGVASYSQLLSSPSVPPLSTPLVGASSAAGGILNTQTYPLRNVENSRIPGHQFQHFAGASRFCIYLFVFYITKVCLQRE